MAKIGLLDVDGHNFPNLPLMKLSAYHKSIGDEVEHHIACMPYDKVYVSKVFDFTPEYTTPIYADEVVYGGTGHDLKNKLPKDVECICPDYTLYPPHSEAYGFLTRGCPRGCSFCIVSEKEGRKSYQVADVSDFYREQREMKLLDPNLLACADRERLLKQLIASKAYIDFTQGLDIRCMTDDIAKLVMQCTIKMIHFAWDGVKDSDAIVKGLTAFKAITGIDERKARVYVLVNYDTDFAFDLERIYKLRELGYDPYVMIYDKQQFVDKRGYLKPLAELLKQYTPKQIKHFKQCHKLQRWVNNKYIYRVCERFEDYKPEVG